MIRSSVSDAQSAYCSNDFIMLQERTELFKKNTGRRPRILLTDMGKTIDVRALRIFALAYADAGFDVDISPVGMTYKTVARMAVENDVHVISISNFGSGQNMLLADLARALKRQGANDIIIILDRNQLIEQKMNKSLDFETMVAHSISKVLSVIGA